MAKRASERYSTGRDMAEDLRHFLETEAAVPSSAPAPSTMVAPAPAATPEQSSPTPAPVRSESSGQPVKIIPKGLRSFDRHDADFFLELLPGARDREGLPDSIRFWKTRIESTDPDATFRVGLIYGPSGCGKSSLVKAGLLPRLGKSILPVYIEATLDETEPRLLKGLRKVCPELSAGGTIAEALTFLRRGRLLRPGEKVLIVIDQFEQWLFARRDEENTDVVAALRQCDGEQIQAIVMVRDDFWMAATRFMRDLEIRLVEGENSAAVDLFDLLHARRVLMALGRAFGVLPEKSSEMTSDQRAFLEQAIAGLAHGGKVISVRLALFAEMVKGKPWTLGSLKEVGGTQGVGVTFLDETFSASTAPPEHRLHQRAAQAILKALLPESGTDIKGQMRSEAELREISGYAGRPRDFDDVIGILDSELRLITPTDPEGSGADAQVNRPGGERYFQLTHDYLVHSLREWLTRKQRETRRGRAELRLAERAAIWADRPENRHLPSVAECLSIGTLSRRKDWTEPQRRMMTRAGWVHGLRAIALGAVAALLGITGFNVWKREADAAKARADSAIASIDGLLKADIAEVPRMIEAMAGYERWTAPELRRLIRDDWVQPKPKLHASIALLPVDGSQVDYLKGRLLDPDPGQLLVLRKILKPHAESIIPMLWEVVESAQPGDFTPLSAAGALAVYDPESPRWTGACRMVAERLVSVDPAAIGLWSEVFKPIAGLLTIPLATIFRDRTRPEGQRLLAASMFKSYIIDEPGMVADLLMDADPKTFPTFFAMAERQKEKTSRVFEAELARNALRSWNDGTLDPAWIGVDAAIKASIESAHGLLDERFAFCQSMAVTQWVATAEKMRESGYRPVRCRPFADGPVVKVAAVWTRDGRRWRNELDSSAAMLRRADERNQKEGYVPVDVAGYTTEGGTGQRTEHYSALWVVREPTDSDARIYAGKSTSEQTELERQWQDEEWIPRTVQVVRGNDGDLRYCGVWGPGDTGRAAREDRNLFEPDFGALRDKQRDVLVVDAAVSEARVPRPLDKRVRDDLNQAEETLKARPKDAGAWSARAIANLRLGEPAKALPDLDALLEENDDDDRALSWRAIARARLHQEKAALEDLAAYRRHYVSDQSKLFLAVAVSAELGKGFELAIKELEHALAKHPDDPELRFQSALAFSLTSKAVAVRNRTEARRLADRSLQSLEQSVHDKEADFRRIDEEAALDAIRNEPRFVELLNAGHPARRYAFAGNLGPSLPWESDVIDAVSPAEHLALARERISQGYRMVACSAARVDTYGPLISTSVWHRPVVSEEEKDQQAARKARAAIALFRLGKADSVWPLLRHSPDPRLRSFLVNWLAMLGADSGSLVDRFQHGDSSARALPLSSRARMDELLFHSETSMHRALILSLGRYGGDKISPDVRKGLTEKLLDLYRNDPDAGIHSASEWTLRQWNERAKIQSIDEELKKIRRGDRRWHVNKQGQTFAEIVGPVEFSMGSPASEPARIADREPQRRLTVPRRFAIATKEVGVIQFQQFLKTNRQFTLSRGELMKFSPNEDGPWIGLDWYSAAAYCNWLSKEEQIPENEWCYLPKRTGTWAQGVTIPADVLDRKGYRLPTEPEWEYACRAGSVTSRYYGFSTDLLGKYGWDLVGSLQQARPVGSLLPNDLGLFDMLGNVAEWCQDRAAGPRPWINGAFSDRVLTNEIVVNDKQRILRGGCFLDQPSELRSPASVYDAPSARNGIAGFRVARTLP
jgi:formylglycine-generating enzyme required for sulfatase activity/tetratricopeptide (TPR) repeat protein